MLEGMAIALAIVIIYGGVVFLIFGVPLAIAIVLIGGIGVWLGEVIWSDPGFGFLIAFILSLIVPPVLGAFMPEALGSAGEAVDRKVRKWSKPKRKPQPRGIDGDWYKDLEQRRYQEAQAKRMRLQTTTRVELDKLEVWEEWSYESVPTSGVFKPYISHRGTKLDGKKHGPFWLLNPDGDVIGKGTMYMDEQCGWTWLRDETTGEWKGSKELLGAWDHYGGDFSGNNCPPTIWIGPDGKGIDHNSEPVDSDLEGRN